MENRALLYRLEFVMPSPHKFFGRNARLGDTYIVIWFAKQRREAVLDATELALVLRYFPKARLHIVPNGRGRLYVRLRWREGGILREESMGRILEGLIGKSCERREVRYLDKNPLNLLPSNRALSAKGAFRGTDTAYQETMRRQWSANNLGHSSEPLQHMGDTASSPSTPLQKLPQGPWKGGER